MGERLRFLRELRALSQTELGLAVGVTFQQIQKYERGLSRVSVATLVSICKTLEIHPMDFMGRYFDENEGLGTTDALMKRLSEAEATLKRIKAIVT